MTKNSAGGKKKKRSASKNDSIRSKRELAIREDLQLYGLVDKMLGDMRCSVLCSDSTMKVCHIRGKFKRRIWINAGDTVLISMREFEDGKADIIHKYTPEEAEMLKGLEEFDPNAYKHVIQGTDGASSLLSSKQDMHIDVNEMVQTSGDDNVEIDFEGI